MKSSVTTMEAMPPLIHDTSPGNLSGALEEFSEFLSSSEITSEAAVCHAHANTPWSTAGVNEKPSLVLFPKSTQDVSAILRICHRRRIPVTSFSGGTSMSGALTATRGGICIDFQKMNRVIAVHEDDLDAVVQPGVMQRELNDHLATKGLFFPPDPSPDARIGGMIAMSCSGTNAYRHGTIKQWIISMTVVLADGTVIKTRQRPRKSSAGYDIAQLMIGSEGTLGLVTEAVIKLTAAPINLNVAIVTFKDVHSAVRTGLELTSSGIMIDAIELLDAVSMAAINISRISPVQWDEKTTLFLKFSGSENAVADQVGFSRTAATRNSCLSFEISREKDTISDWWSAGKNVGKALLAFKKTPSDVFVPSDAAVPIPRLADLMVASQQMLVDAGLHGSVVGHLGDGNIHVVIVCPADQKEAAYNVIARVQTLAIEYEGTITGEHGVGLALRDKLLEEVGPGTVDLMRTIKLALDPHCILNCDKIFRLEATSTPAGAV